MVNDHTRSAENWKCLWYLFRLYIYIYIRVYVDSHSLGQLALASKRTASIISQLLLLFWNFWNMILNMPKLILLANIKQHVKFEIAMYAKKLTNTTV